MFESTEWFYEPGPSVKREWGIQDARAGKPKLSADADYLVGYGLAESMGLQPEQC